jgi:hypothetical protein
MGARFIAGGSQSGFRVLVDVARFLLCLELALVDEQGEIAERLPLRCDVRSWQPGPFAVEERVGITSRPGRYKLAIGILDPSTGRPGIAFANKTPIHEGWAVISSVEVGPDR